MTDRNESRYFINPEKIFLWKQDDTTYALRFEQDEDIRKEDVLTGDPVQIYLVSEKADHQKDYETEKQNPDQFVMPIWVYDHSGQSISCDHTYPYNDCFDSRFYGFAIVKKDTLINEGSADETNWKLVAERYIRIEVTLYNDYLNGNVWFYTLYKCKTEDKPWKKYPDYLDEWDEVDATGGFIGDDLIDTGVADSLDDAQNCGFRTALDTGKVTELTLTARRTTRWELTD